MKKRVISLLLAMVMVLSLLPVTAFAQSTCTLTVGTVSGAPGSLVEVPISITHNPGIISATFSVAWDEGLTLEACANGDAWSRLSFTPPGQMVSGCSFVWFGNDPTPQQDGTILNLSFRIPENAKEADSYTIRLKCRSQDITDGSLSPVSCEQVNGGVQVFSYTPGDVNTDKKINPLDLVMLSRYIADGNRTNPGGYNVTVHLSASNVNGDDKISPLDLVFISRYIADDCTTNPKGYNITLKYSLPICPHQLQAVPYKDATCTKPGNVAYWQCSLCGKLYNDADASQELTAQQTVLQPKGHTWVIDPYKAPTTQAPGLTEGKHCSVCGHVEIVQQEIPPLVEKTYSIHYHVDDSDNYLASIHTAEKNPNPLTHSSNTELKLKNMPVIPGYTFLGWYTLGGDAGTQVTGIPAGNTDPIELYAHWKANVYDIVYDSPDVAIELTDANSKYSINKTTKLADPPRLFGYTFVGWSMNGNIIQEIKPGSIPEGSQSFEVHANWTSDRNMARPYNQPQKPSVIEDVANGRYLFLYKVGTIENVPINVTRELNFGKVENLNVEKGASLQTTVQEAFTDTAAVTVANATTRSSSWTLSEDWSSSVSAMNEQDKKVGMSDSHTKTSGDTVSGKWYVSNSQSGTTQVSNQVGGSSSVSAKVTNQESTGINTDYSHQWGSQSSQDRKHSVEVGAHAKAKKFGVDFDAGVDYKYTNDKHDESYDDKSLQVSTSRNTNHEFVGSNSSSANWNASQSVSSSWNQDSGYEQSHSASREDAISKSISQEISNKYQVSGTKSEGAEKAYSNATSDTNTQQKEYSSTVERSLEQGVTITTTQTYTSPYMGYYRLVTASTIHVFAVVGYDIASGSYFTYTYNVLDANDRHPYLDYSKESANFDDCENGVLPFEIPYEVQEYVGDKLARSQGLEIDLTTGKVTGYTGTDEYVVIPEYVPVDTHNGKHVAVKVTGFAASAFRGNTDIRGVYLPKYISEIPDNAFDGCTALDTIICNGVTSIGDHAFRNCPAMSGFQVDHLIGHLGTGTFDGIDSVQVTASTPAVADAALTCGAKNLTLDLQKLTEPFNDRKIVVSQQTETFRLWDSGTPRTNLQLESKADTTVLNHVNLVQNQQLPLKIYSPNLTLNRVTVEKAPGLAMVLFADRTNIQLFANTQLSSAGQTTLLAKKLSLSREDPSVVGKLNVAGQTLLVDTVIDNASMFSGTVQAIASADFDNYLNARKVSFNANGGQVTVGSKVVNYNSPYGELPVPTRTGYTFDGWYTAAEGGSRVTADTVFTAAADITLYAHWTCQAFTARWQDAEGCVIAVKRTASPQAGAAIGTIASGSAVYYGDTLEITYTPKAGYLLRETGLTSVTVTRDLTAADIYAAAADQVYHATWENAAGCNISVERTSSPRGGSLGTLESGAEIYYGDVLKVVYQAAAGYTLTSSGEQNITVTGNVDRSVIHAAATANSYTYKIVYQSTNGTPLGTATVTHVFGTTNTVTPKGFSGYNTPAAQSVAWDSVSAKTITFQYKPSNVAQYQHPVSGAWWTYQGNTALSYQMDVEIGRRFKDGVDIRITWTNQIQPGKFFGFAQYFNGSAGTRNFGEHMINSASAWGKGSANVNKLRTKSVQLDWIRVPLNTTAATTVTIRGQFWDSANGRRNYSGTIQVPAW